MSVKKRGFGSMTPEQIHELASKGGKTSWKNGKAHKFTHEQAVLAGKKGRKKPVLAL